MLTSFSGKVLMSTSKKTDTAFGGNVTIQVLSKICVDIEDLSYYKYEKDVLFGSDTKFQVVKKIRLSDGTWNIEIIEKG